MRRKLVVIMGSIVIGISTLLFTYFSLISAGLVQARVETLIITTDSLEVQYNGEEHYTHNYEISRGELFGSHELILNFTETITNVGEKENLATAKIVDKNNLEITDQYNIEILYGILKVNPREITVKSSSSFKQYDTLELYNHIYVISKGSLVTDHQLDVTFLNSITEIGNVENTFSVRVVDIDGKDVTEFYNITPIYGSLEIVKRQLVIKTFSSYKIYDGLGLMKEGFEILQGSLLKNHQLNDYNYNTIFDAQEIPNTFGYDIVDDEGEDVKDYYEVIFDYGFLTIDKRDLVIQSASAHKQYDGFELTEQSYYINFGTLAHNNYLIDTNYRSIVLPQITDNYFEAYIINDYGKDVTYNYNLDIYFGYLEIEHRYLLIQSNSKTKAYDGHPLEERTYEIKEGSLISGHRLHDYDYASINEIEFTSNSFNAYITDQAGNDVTELYNLDIYYGYLEIYQIYLEIRSGTSFKEYDGKPLTNTQEPAIIWGKLLPNHFMSYQFSNEITDVGRVENIFSVEIEDIDGNDVSGYYQIYYYLGELEVYKRNLEITSHSNNKIYDGYILNAEDFNITEGSLVPNDEIVIYNYNSIYDPGIVENTFDYYIIDQEGNDVTYRYNVYSNFGTLEVFERPITVKSNSKTKAYDGYELFEHSYELIAGNLLGYDITAYNYASITNPGIVDNSFYISIHDYFGNDYTHYFDITYEYGTLEVYKTKLTFKTTDKTKVYDGYALYGDTYELIGELSSSHYVVDYDNASITEPGTTQNSISVDIYDWYGRDVSNFYDISYEFGTLEILKKKISIRSLSGSKTYDGYEFSLEDIELFAGNLVGYDFIEGYNYAKITKPGTTDNSFGFNIYNGFGKDVTSYYDVTFEYGVLEVTKINLNLRSENISKEYDGKELSNYYDLIFDQNLLLHNHQIFVDFKGSITEPGVIDNYFTVAMYNDDEGDLTKYYNINYIYGKLEVLKRHLPIRSHNLSKEYDGEPLYGESYDYSYLLPYHNLIVTFNNQITKVGTVDNSFTAIIKNASGHDITHYYDISKSYGDLVVYRRYLQITSDGDSKEYDGLPLYNHFYDINIGSVLDNHHLIVDFIMEITEPEWAENRFNVTIKDENGDDVTDYYEIYKSYNYLHVYPIYLYYESYSESKAYDGIPLKNHNFYVYTYSILDGHEAEIIFLNEITEIGTTINEFTLEIFDENNNNVSHYYDINTYFGTLEIYARYLEIYSIDSHKQYDGEALWGLGHYTHYYSLLDGHEIESTFYNSITEPGTISNEFMAAVIDENGKDVSKYYDLKLYYGTLEITKRIIEVTSGNANKQYDGSPLTEHSSKITDGSLLYGHNLETNYLGTITEPGIKDNLFEAKVTDNWGNGLDNYYEINKVYGSLEITLIPISISSQNHEKEYDGKALINIKNLIIIGELLAGHEIESTFYNLITEPGTTINEFSVIVVDRNYNDVSKYYDLKLYKGALEVIRRVIEVTSGSASKEYDGSSLTEYSYNISDGSLLDDHYLNIDYLKTITNPGITANLFDAFVTDSSGNSLEAYYKINKVYGNLEITPRTISTSSANHEKEYDANPLINSKDLIYSNKLLPGHELDVTFTESITEPGYIDNIYNVKVLSSSGEDVSKYYNITKAYGTLEVLKRFIEITSGSAKKEYDGSPLTEHSSEITNGSLLITHSLNINYLKTLTEIGETPNMFEAVILDADGNNVNKYYQLKKTSGNLEIIPITISTSSANHEKEYDRTPLINTKDLIYSDKLLPGHELDVSFTKSIIKPGTVDNSYTVKVLSSSGEDVSKYYNITKAYGTLKILKRVIEISSESSFKVYDRSELINHNYKIITGSLLDNHHLNINYLGTITDPGIIDNLFEVTITDNEGNDLDDYYKISKVYGTLEIIPILISTVSLNHQKEYDGKPLVNFKDLIITGKLLIGDELDVFFTKSIIKPGLVDNSYTVKVLNSDGEDVSEYYSITKVYGTLEVLKRVIEITSDSDFKEYDQSPLIKHSYQITEGSLLASHILNIDYTGTITEIGHTLNTFKAMIVDNEGNDLKDYYELNKVYGNLEVTLIIISTSSEDHEKEYDGKPLINIKDLNYSNKLLPGHELDVTFTESIIVPGTTLNKYIVKILDSSGNDVTDDYYNIIKFYNTLEVVRRKLELTSDNKSKEYDQTPLTHHSSSVTNGSLLAIEQLVINYLGTITDPGIVDNNFNVTILNDSGEDITKYYLVTKIYGTLEVRKINIKVSSQNVKKEYDGTPLINNKEVIVEGQLLDDHNLNVEFINQITEPGTVLNAFNVKVEDSANNNLGKYYNITKEYGNLTVERIKITITSGSKQKVYDGIPLVDERYFVTEGNFLSNHNPVIETIGSITDIGSVENTIIAIVYDLLNNNVNKYYEFILKPGTLSVISRPFSGSTDIAIPNMPAKKTDLLVYSNVTGTAYLRDHSYGDYIYTGFGNAISYEGEINPLSFPAYLLETLNLGTKAYIKLDPLDNYIPYLTTYYTAENLDNQNDLFVSKPYDKDLEIPVFFYHHFLDYFLSDPSVFELSINDQDFITQELAYREFVYNNYLNLPESTYNQILQIGTSNGIDPQSLSLIVDIKTYIQNAATYNLNGKNPDHVDDIVIYFLTESKEGICQHYAAAATVMYRAYGIPARYTTGYMANVNSHQWTEVCNCAGHAWVEIYLDGFGWVPVEVTGSETKPEVTVSLISKFKKYDGETLYPTDIIIDGLDYYLGLGYQVEYDLIGSQTELGKSKSSVDNFIIKDENGNDVTNSFAISFKEGILHVYSDIIALKTYDNQKDYDGTPLKETDSENYLLEGLLPGHSVKEVIFTGEQTAVGTSSNQAKVIIVDQNGNDVTDHYLIVGDFGRLEVNPRSITIVTEGASKEFDNTPLQNNNYYIDGELIGDEVIHVEIIGRQTGIGVSENTIGKVTIYKDGEDVTRFYNISYEYGLLVVYP